MSNSIKLLDYRTKHSYITHSLLKPLLKHGLNYYNEHYFGIGCYEPVYVYYFGFDTTEHLHEAVEVVEKTGFTPLMNEGFDPFEIILTQPITKKYEKEIRADIGYYEGLRELERKQYAERQKLWQKREKARA